MEWIIFTDINIKQYEDFIDSQNYSGIWHTSAWLDFQIKTGKVTDGFFFGISRDNNLIFTGLYLIKKTGKINSAYIPAGFLYTEFSEDIYNFFIKNLNDIAKANKIVFTQIDSIRPYDDNFVGVIRKDKQSKLNQKLPIPQYTNIIDLSLTEDDILSKMKPKGRYNIKLAEKKGVNVRFGTVDDIPQFYSILEETTKRDGFRPNNEDYYKKMIDIIGDSRLLVAYHEDDILACGIFTFTKFQGLYYYGASSNIKRNLMAPYLLQWEAVKIAKEKGCIYFDFMGIANPDDPKDRLIGVTDFKLKFSENIVKFNPSYIVIHKSIIYNIFGLFREIKNLLKI